MGLDGIFGMDEDGGDLSTINMMIYGYPGIGKSVFWGTGGPKTLMMDSDSGGTEAARAQGSKAKRIRVNDYDQLDRVYQHLAHDKHGFRWVVWDSLTLFQDRALIDDILPDAAALNPKQSAHVASQREYLINQNRIGNYVRLFADLPVNFGISCHVMIGEDGEAEDGGIILKPDIRGKKGSFSSYIAGYMNVVCYYGRTPAGKRRLITERQDKYFAKDRFDALRTGGKPFLDNATLPNVDKMISDKLKASGRQLATSN